MTAPTSRRRPRRGGVPSTAPRSHTCCPACASRASPRFAGGVGKTTLAVEVATLVAAHARYRTLEGEELPLRVLLLDASRVTAGAAGIRLGLDGEALSRASNPVRWRHPRSVEDLVARHRLGRRCRHRAGPPDDPRIRAPARARARPVPRRSRRRLLWRRPGGGLPAPHRRSRLAPRGRPPPPHRSRRPRARRHPPHPRVAARRPSPGQRDPRHGRRTQADPGRQPRRRRQGRCARTPTTTACRSRARCRATPPSSPPASAASPPGRSIRRSRPRSAAWPRRSGRC